MHTSPSVFSFFLPEYMPNGRVADAGLVAPEALVATAPTVVGFLNGMASLIKCRGGFGANGGSCANVANARTQSHGFLTYAPRNREPSAAIEEMALLLTNGRLSPSSRAVFEAAVQEALSRSGEEAALEVAMKLFITSAEFHTNVVNLQLANAVRVPPPPQAHHGRPYKAVVVL